MTIQYVNGDIFKSSAQALVNPVNTVGVMGAGLAKKFKEKFPENFKVYKFVCDQKNLVVGDLLVCKDGGKTIINFPTKQHWNAPSLYQYIEDGLVALLHMIKDQEITSLAIPALGCGLGGLNWDTVKHMIETSLFEVNETCRIEIYPPADAMLQEALANPPKAKMTRLETNREIILKLEDYLEANPDMRFIQALWALDVIERDKDKFYEESTRTLETITERSKL